MESPSSMTPANPLDQAIQLQPIQTPHTTPTQDEPEIWIGYTKQGRNYLDKQVKAPNTEQQIHALKQYYELRFCRRERLVSRWIYCRRPVVQIGEIEQAVQGIVEDQFLPREVRFKSVETSLDLSTAFLHPESLRESGRMFHEGDLFDVVPIGAGGTRNVLCIGHVLHKAYLLWPLAASFGIAVVAAIITGVATASVSTGVESGGFVGVAVTLCWSFVLWLLR